MLWGLGCKDFEGAAQRVSWKLNIVEASLRGFQLFGIFGIQSFDYLIIWDTDDKRTVGLRIKLGDLITVC